MISKTVVLIFPHVTRGWQAHPRVELPLGLLCVATPLVRAGYRVKIIDQRVDRRWRRSLRDELERGPICVGVTAMTGSQLTHALEVSRIVKRTSAVPVVWGGVHATILPAQTLRSGVVDVVVAGEGEETLLELVEALERRKSLRTVRGLWYREQGEVAHTAARPPIDLNQLAPPSYELVDLGRYLRKIDGVDHLNLFTSRGCPHRCTFCFNHPFGNARPRMIDADVAVRQIVDFARTHGVRGITFIDNNFFTDLERGRAILRGLLESGLALRISKIAIRVETLLAMTEDDLALLERVGCRRLTFAVESGCERVRRLLGKPIDVAALLELNRRLRRSTMAPSYLFMMGVPTETPPELNESVRLLLRLLDDNPKAQGYFNIYLPLPGTELFARAVACGFRAPRRTEDWAALGYRHLTDRAPWLTGELRRMVETIDFCTFFVGNGGLRRPHEPTARSVRALAALYTPIAELRLRRSLFGFPLEVRLARLLRAYGRPG